MTVFTTHGWRRTLRKNGGIWLESLSLKGMSGQDHYMKIASFRCLLTIGMDTFFAGLSTTQRSESINSFFDKYVSKKTSLKEFIKQYKVALQDRQEKEAYASFSTLHKKPVLKSPSPFEKQMSAIYTHEVFKKFQVEI